MQQWLCEEKLVEQLVDKFVKADEDPDMQECIAQTFQDLVLVSTSMFSVHQKTPEIVARLESEYVVNTLFVHILQSVCDFSSFFCSLGVLAYLLLLHPSTILSTHRCFLAVERFLWAETKNNPFQVYLFTFQFPVNMISQGGYIVLLKLFLSISSEFLCFFFSHKTLQ